MKLSSPKQLNTQIYSEASDWLVEFRSGDVEADGRRAFYAWLLISPEHMRAYLELAAIWNEGGRLDPGRRFDDEDLVQRARSESNVVPLVATSAQRQQVSTEARREAPIFSLGTTARRVGWRGRVVAVTASALVAIFGAWAYSERNTYATGIGEQRSLVLEDGSTIALNTHSKIRVRFTHDRRAVDLVQGQALFHVAKDRTRPFIVQSDETKVRAIGTEFDVYRKMTGTTVTVIEGRVAVLSPSPTLEPVPPESLLATAQGTSLRSDPRETGPEVEQTPGGKAEAPAVDVPDPRNAKEKTDRRDSRKEAAPPGGGPVAKAGEFLLGAGEQAILTPQTTVKPKQPDIAAATAWTQRHLIFQAATLTEVTEEFNRYNARKLIVGDPALADFHITGVFSSTNLGSIIHFLRGRPGIRITEKDGEILIARSPQ